MGLPSSAPRTLFVGRETSFSAKPCSRSKRDPKDGFRGPKTGSPATEDFSVSVSPHRASGIIRQDSPIPTPIPGTVPGPGSCPDRQPSTHPLDSPPPGPRPWLSGWPPPAGVPGAGQGGKEIEWWSHSPSSRFPPSLQASELRSSNEAGKHRRRAPVFLRRARGGRSLPVTPDGPGFTRPARSPLTWASLAATRLRRARGRRGITRKCTGACGDASRKAMHCEKAR